jgi:hypothetical protein
MGMGLSAQLDRANLENFTSTGRNEYRGKCETPAFCGQKTDTHPIKNKGLKMNPLLKYNNLTLCSYATNTLLHAFNDH